jgi:iron complex outermembrane receptor protein
VNLLVKHADTRVRQLRLEARQVGELLAAADIGERFGPEGRYGLRVNAVAERLDPPFRHSRGERSLLALAADWQAGAETLLQAEIESSHQRQPSVTGFSMLGNAVPDARRIDPRTNLNDQPWTQPVVLDGDTASLRWQQGLAPGWRLTVQAQQQRLRSDDRTAFPYGVYDSALYACPQWCDRFAPDGSFTYWQYISDRERRTSSAASATLAGTARSGQVDHAFEVGVLGSTFRGRFQDQVFDIAGTGRIDDSLQTPPSPGGSAANVDRDERSSELFLRDRIALGAAAQLWTGLRHTRLQRSSQLTRPGPDGWEATHYPQSATLPWLALLRPLATSTLAYASWGEGLESEVVPGRALYTNAGQALPALKSRQFELGLKHAAGAFEGSLTLFDIDRPQSADRGACDLSASCTRVIDGSDHHRGIEVAASWRGGHWAWQTSVQGLRAERRGSADPAINGHRPVNVPAASLRLSAEFRVPQQAGLALAASLHADSDRVVLPSDDSVRIPGWARLELGARWRIETGRTSWVWRLGLDNATDRRAWKESPYQFSHVYLYPLAPRTWRSSVEASL